MLARPRAFGQMTNTKQPRRTKKNPMRPGLGPLVDQYQTAKACKMLTRPRAFGQTIDFLVEGLKWLCYHVT